MLIFLDFGKAEVEATKAVIKHKTREKFIFDYMKYW